MRISDWSSDVCSSDLLALRRILHSHKNHKTADGIKRGQRCCAAREQNIKQHDDGRHVIPAHPEYPQGTDPVFCCGRAQSTPQGFEVNHHRSEEHTSELQSLMRNTYDVFCLKKKK